MTRKEVLDKITDLIAGGLGKVPDGEEAVLLRELIRILEVMVLTYEAPVEGLNEEQFAAKVMEVLERR